MPEVSVSKAPRIECVGPGVHRGGRVVRMRNFRVLQGARACTGAASGHDVGAAQEIT